MLHKVTTPPTEQGQLTAHPVVVQPSNTPATSQELSVAQMMMTLAQASATNRNALGSNTSNSDETNTSQFSGQQTPSNN